MHRSEASSRYLAYCHAHGHYEPDDMYVEDCKRHPGGPMVGAILWINAQWRAWGETVGGLPEPRLPRHHEQFDAWLASQYPEPTKHHDS